MFVWNFCIRKPWLPGVMLRRDGLLSFMVGITNGQVFRRHLNHLHTQIADLLPEVQDTDEWSYFEPEEQTLSGKKNLRTNGELYKSFFQL